MSNERIQFGLNGIGVEVDFDIDRIRFGRVVHVETLDGSHQFSSAATERSDPYRIVDVLLPQPEGYRPVTLARELYLSPGLVGRVYSAIGGTIQESEIADRLCTFAGEITFEQLHNNKRIAASSIKRVEAVLDRLDLLAALERHNALWAHHRPLVAYLHLTCFDLLGQTREWCNFSEWLRSGATRAEREEAMAGLTPGADPVAAARHLDDWYNSRYSVRRGFERFVRKMLPEDVRQRLLRSVKIKHYVMPPLKGEHEPPIEQDDEMLKIKWLFGLRNGYTHNAIYVPGLRKDDLPADFRSEGTSWMMDYEKSAEFKTTYSVSDWPRILGDCVRAGLATFVVPSHLEIEKAGPHG